MRSPRPSALRRTTVLICVLGSILTFGSSAPAADWPPEALRLLPPDPVLVVGVPSAVELEAKIVDLVGRFDAGLAAEVDLLDEMRGWAGPHLETLDGERPFLFSVHLATAGQGMGPFSFAFVAALETETSVPDSADGFSVIAREGRWIAVASDGTLAPGERIPALARDLPREDIVARADVGRLAVTFGPMIEMGLANLMSGGNDGGAAVPAAQVEALLGAVRLIMENVTTLEATLGGGEELRLSAALELFEGSPLSAPSPQPSMRRAKELAGFLPGDAAFHYVAAIDLSPWNEFLIPTWEASLEPMAQASGVEATQLVDRLISLLELYRVPSAMSLDFADEGLEMLMLFEVEDAARLRESIVTAFGETASPRFPFYLATRGTREYEDWTIRRYKLEADLEAMSDYSGDEQEAMAEGMALASTMIGVVTAWLPPMDIAVRDDVLVAAMHAGEGDTELLLQRMDQQRTIPTALSRAMDWAGKDARIVSSLDVRVLLQGVVTMFQGMASLDPVPEGPPATLDYAVEAEGDRLLMRARLDLDALNVVFDAVQSWTNDTDDDVDNDNVDAWKLESSAPPAGSIGGMSELEIEEMTDTLRGRVEELRGHEFIHAVPVKVVDDAQAREFFVTRMTESMPPEWMRSYQDMLIDLEQLPPETDLEALIYELLEEQAGGFYDPGSGIFFLLDDMPKSTASMIIVHELTHALDDQLYDLDRMLLDEDSNDDERAAASAVVEGSGTLAMTQFLMQEMMGGRMSQADLQDFQQSEAGKAEALEGAPPVLKRGLLAPYLLGNAFLLRGELTNVVAGIDPDDVDRAFREPPRSMEQILHPEKYWDESSVDTPRRVELPELAETAGRGWQKRWGGSLGELDLAMLTQSGEDDLGMMQLAMGEGWTNPAAEGWDGDAWVLLQRAEATVTVLAVVWDDEAEAREFVASYVPPVGAVVRQQGDRVVIVAGELPERAEALAKKALEGLKVE